MAKETDFEKTVKIELYETLYEKWFIYISVTPAQKQPARKCLVVKTFLNNDMNATCLVNLFDMYF